MNQNKTLKSEEDWKKELNEAQYTILRKKGPKDLIQANITCISKMEFTIVQVANHHCLKSQTKFDAGCGWPSFDASIKGNVSYVLDKSHGMMRTEIVCSSCEGHLGHVFNDGPTETGTRYCVNSLSLTFKNSK